MIATFGCSHTGGFTEDQTWPHLLSTQVKDNVYNLGHPATSLSFSVQILKQFKKKYPRSKTILQVTRPNRFTVLEEFDFQLYLIQQEENYYCFDKSKTGELLKTYIGASRMCNKYIGSEDDLQYYRQTVTKHSELDQLNFIANIYYAKQYADLVFFHQTPNHQLLKSEPQLKDILCLETQLGDRFKDYCLDDAAHFNRFGSLWQSNYIKEYMKL